MMQLHQDKAAYEAQETKIIIVGPESKEAFQEYFKHHDLDFIGIPDGKSNLLKLYGQEIKLFKLGRMPGQVLIDKEGTARFVYYGHDMMDIPKNQEVLEILQTLS